MKNKNKQPIKLITPEEEDKPVMIETLVMIIVMTFCACGLLYVLVKLLISFLGSVSINIPG